MALSTQILLVVLFGLLVIYQAESKLHKKHIVLSKKEIRRIEDEIKADVIRKAREEIEHRFAKKDNFNELDETLDRAQQEREDHINEEDQAQEDVENNAKGDEEVTQDQSDLQKKNIVLSKKELRRIEDEIKADVIRKAREEREHKKDSLNELDETLDHDQQEREDHINEEDQAPEDDENDATDEEIMQNQKFANDQNADAVTGDKDYAANGEMNEDEKFTNDENANAITEDKDYAANGEMNEDAMSDFFNNEDEFSDNGYENYPINGETKRRMGKKSRWPRPFMPYYPYYRPVCLWWWHGWWWQGWRWGIGIGRVRSLTKATVRDRRISPLLRQFERENILPMLKKFKTEQIDPMVAKFKAEQIAPLVAKFEKEMIEPMVKGLPATPEPRRKMRHGHG